MGNPRQQTTLTQQDLRIYASERLIDTPDGGGEMTSHALTGTVNELFPVVSDFARVNGQVNARLVYPAVLKPLAASLWGANMILDEPSQSAHVSYLLAEADFYGQERASIMERLEGYRVPSTKTRMTLYGVQRKGSRLVQVYQRENVALPVVGQCFALTHIENGKPIYEFFRVESYTHSLQTFEDERGEFIRRVVKMVTQSALERDFEGMEDVSRFDGSPDARVLDTQIADSAKYYGIKPLAAPIVAGSVNLRVPSLYEQLVPVSTVETAMVDDWAQGREMWIETAPRRDVYSGYRYMNSGSLFLETPVLPKSVQMGDWEDDGAGSLKRGEQILHIDYANGVISGFSGVAVERVSAIPAVLVRNHAYSSYSVVDDTTVGTEWTFLLRPAPARGSVQVSYMHGREWYELSDLGDYQLRDNQGVRGQISKNGSVAISLPVLPDSGSKIVVSWCPHGFYQTIDEQDAGSVIVPQTASTELTLPANPIPNLKPNTVRLTWAGGSARDDGRGNLLGDCTGKVNYATGVIYPKGLQAATVDLRAKQYIAVPQTSTPKIALGSQHISLVADTLQAGSLRLALYLQRQTTTGYTVKDTGRNTTLWVNGG